MKLLVVAFAVLAVAAALPQKDEVPQIVRSSYDQTPEGGYQFDFESSNGINRQETGELKQVLDEENKPQNVVVVRGQYSYSDSEGQQHQLSYTADETGFHADSADIPVVPAARR